MTIYSINNKQANILNMKRLPRNTFKILAKRWKCTPKAAWARVHISGTPEYTEECYKLVQEIRASKNKAKTIKTEMRKIS